MARLFKILLVLLAGVVGIVILASATLFLFFDPNDFRDKISAAVQEETGRELVIEGDLSLTVFPWLAVEIGRTRLGNAGGFSAERFLSFERASLSVRLLPLIFQQQIKVGTASLDGLQVNLEVARNGTTNWDDLAEGGESSAADESAGTGSAEFDVANIRVNNANVSYTDAQAGSSYAISELSFETGRIATNMPIKFAAEFNFDSSPGVVGGYLAIRGESTISEGVAQVSVRDLNVSGELRGVVAEATDFNFDARQINIDTVAQSVTLGEMDLMVLGLSMSADVQPFSYAGAPQPSADLRVAVFSLKDLMRVLDTEPPVTMDPDALGRVSFRATASVGETEIALTAMTLELDDSTLTGTLTLPLAEDGAFGFDLGVDAIVLDGYMAPTDASLAADDDALGDMEIPADLIRTLNANGTFRIERAFLSGMQFENLELGVNSGRGKLRLYPLAADFYEGTYRGDVRIDASGDIPTVSANENISGVNLGAMIRAMFDQDNITGTINGGFVLAGSGRNLAAIQQDLDGNMSIELRDGALEGTDIWYQLRRARAMYRQEPAPEPVLPARTAFTAVRATGIVTRGIFTNDDFLAELPFLQLTGKGMVDLTSTEIDYAMQVRVFDRPEFMSGATEDELADFTQTVVPIKITGTLSAPNIRPDIEGIFRGRVEEAIEEKKEELKNKLFNKLLGGQEEPPAAGALAPEDEQAPEEEPEEDLEEALKKKLLNKLFDR
jgi:AsmA protein